MLARLVLGAVTAAAVIGPALAGMMNAEEARRFVSGKVFAFTCFDGTRGAGRILDDLGAAGSIQFSGSGPIRNVRLPGNTLQIRGQAEPFHHTDRNRLRKIAEPTPNPMALVARQTTR